MITQTQNSTPSQKEIFIKMVLSAWETQNSRLDKLLSKLSDEQLVAEVTPGRNSGVYLLGHLVAINDAMIPLLGFGDRLYPQLENIFISNPDKSGFEKPAIADLKKYWVEVNAELSRHISIMHPDEWFTRHNSVSDEDFAKEPHRNKLNILINRANHQSYHLGQLAFL